MSTETIEDATALRDMLDDARLELEMLREALGVPYEPHQSLHERMLEEARRLRAIGGVVRRGDLSLDARHREVRRGECTVGLTQREWVIFKCLGEHAGRYVEKERLLELLNEGGGTAGLNAVEVYVSRLRPKLALLGTRIDSCRGIGYRLWLP